MSEVITSDIELGQLAELYEEFRNIIEPIDPDETIQVRWYEEIVADNVVKAQKSLPIDADHETYMAAMEKARFATYSARRHALIQNGFGGSIGALFQEVIEAEPGSTEDINSRLRLYEKIPDKHLLGACLVTDRGYYWGGRLTPYET